MWSLVISTYSTTIDTKEPMTAGPMMTRIGIDDSDSSPITHPQCGLRDSRNSTRAWIRSKTPIPSVATEKHLSG